MTEEITYLKCPRCDSVRLWTRSRGQPPGSCFCKTRRPWTVLSQPPEPVGRKRPRPAPIVYLDLPSDAAGRNVLVGLSLVAAYHAGWCAGQPRGNY